MDQDVCPSNVVGNNGGWCASTFGHKAPSLAFWAYLHVLDGDKASTPQAYTRTTFAPGTDKLYSLLLRQQKGEPAHKPTADDRHSTTQKPQGENDKGHQKEPQVFERWLLRETHAAVLVKPTERIEPRFLGCDVHCADQGRLTTSWHEAFSCHSSALHSSWCFSETVTFESDFEARGS